MTIAVPEPPERADTDGLVALPCHHGCTSRMQEQTVYGGRTGVRPADTFDPGEMAACVTAVGEATKLLNGYHQFVEARVTRTVAAYAEAERDINALARLETDVARARTDLEAERDRFAGLSPSKQRTPGPVARAAAHALVGLIAAFDVWYFYEAFANILGISYHAALWMKALAGLPGVTMAAALILTSKVLAGPIWRLVDQWRRTPGPEDPPVGRVMAVVRVAALLAFPAVVLTAFGVWAVLRPMYAENPSGGFPAGAIALLLLTLAFAGITAEVLVHSPEARKVERARRRVRTVETRRGDLQDAATASLARLETSWRALRNDGHTLITLVRAELGRAWENVILPARLRHLRTGDYAPEALGNGIVIGGEIVPDEETGVPEEGAGLSPADGLRAEMSLVWQFFAGLRQPEPAPGPLATVIENVEELDPAPLRRRFDHAVRGLDRDAHNERTPQS